MSEKSGKQWRQLFGWLELELLPLAQFYSLRVRLFAENKKYLD
ncbi:Sensor protein basS/pmrB [Pseudomonas synxantha]|nr:Sensor protein basS/pmrB [Pseudomonas synxantha]AZE79674.1 Sensor protein basS/pmrB [Pseudomonas synxantha]